MPNIDFVAERPSGFENDIYTLKIPDSGPLPQLPYEWNGQSMYAGNVVSGAWRTWPGGRRFPSLHDREVTLVYINERREWVGFRKQVDVFQTNGWYQDESIHLSGPWQLNESYKRAVATAKRTTLADYNIHSPELRNIIVAFDYRAVEYLSSHPEGLYALTPREFEEFIAELFDGFGFDVQLTAQTRDGGRDVIAVRKRIVSVKYLIECKRYSPHIPVSVEAVRALYGVKCRENATKGILATTSRFTASATQEFADNVWEMELTDYNGLLEWIDTYQSLKLRKDGGLLI